MKRILSLAALLILLTALAALVILPFTGASPNTILALLAVLIIFPVLIYAFLLGARTFGPGRDDKDNKNATDKKE